MKNRIFIFRTALFILLAIYSISDLSAQSRNPAKSVVKPLPNLSLSTVDGRKWNLSEQRGSVVLLNFWATWCAPCRSEIPFLVRLSAEYKTKGLKVVGVSVDSENLKQINAFIEQYKINYPILLAVPGSALSQQKAVPMSLLIDEKGVLAKKYVGAVKEDVIEKDIGNLLKKRHSRTNNSKDK